ncbi:hypothetical protein H072_2817 [Dactylellina haptotyla CBS 200.50]|uniref:Uncharacterized protein n=1 Tax=Dactylellina haptotyla (strain CBS 200.50) TaxID=1284197 RepID=S8BUK6_DACHA|nr:hypothetical protein H072_2817 [Dactylellina haptotyla CBS 200.50]
MQDGLLLPCYDDNRVPIKYYKVFAQPGDPLQIHFMIWSQQVIHDIDLPNGEDEFLDIRVELTLDGRLIDVGYINQKDIKPNGLPVEIELIGERCGDAREYPMFFNSSQSSLVEDLSEASLNVLVTLGRIGNYFYYDKTKVMSKMVRTGPVHGKYESSVMNSGDFDGYIWRKEHQNLIRDRPTNPKTKLWAWKRRWMQNDVYRQKLHDKAFERCQMAWEELEREAEEESDGKLGTIIVAPNGLPDHISTPQAERVKVCSKFNSTQDIAVSALATAQKSITKSAATESPYLFRRTRRSDVSTLLDQPKDMTPKSEPSIYKRQYPLSDSSQEQLALVPKQPQQLIRDPKPKSLPPTNSKQQSPLTTIRTRPPPSGNTRFPGRGITCVQVVQKGDPQQPSSSNVAFGVVPFKTTRQYYRGFTAYQDLCRVNYQIINPKTRELRSGARAIGL